MNILDVANQLDTRLEVFAVGQMVVVSLAACFVHDGSGFSTAMGKGYSLKSALTNLRVCIQGKSVCNKAEAVLASREGHWYKVPEKICLPRIC